MRAQSRAVVAHRTPTRIRIKIANRAGLQAHLAEVERVFADHPDVVRVHLNPLTGSVIIQCRKGFDLTAEHRQLLGLETLEAEGMPRAICPSHRRRPNGDIAVSSGTLTLALIAKLILGITRKQVAVQVIEWVIDAFVQAARHERQPQAVRRTPMIAVPAE
jgi:hypothetical protein